MTKEKLVNLTNYMNDMIDRLKGNTPEKHKDHPEQYKNFLKHEIELVKAKLDDARLEGVK